MIRVRVRFVPRDLWIGVFIDREKTDKASGDFVQRTYITLIPMFPIVIENWREWIGS